MRAPITVIIPCYRCADTIERAVESVIQQTLLPKEILLVEDCSQDDGKTLAALYRLQRVFQDRVVIKIIPLTQNSGPGGARNAGWDAAQQPYLAFLDADDAWHPRKLEIQLGWLEAHPDVVLCGHLSMLATNHPWPQLECDPVVHQISSLQMLISNRLPTRSVVVRRDIPFRFRSQRLAEDYFLWLEIILSGAPAWLLGIPLACAFRPEFSPGGCSGQLWAHEKCELNVFWTLWREGSLALPTATLGSLWAILKFLRRLLTAEIRKLRT